MNEPHSLIILLSFLGGQISMAFINIVTTDRNLFARIMKATNWKASCSLFRSSSFPCRNPVIIFSNSRFIGKFGNNLSGLIKVSNVVENILYFNNKLIFMIILVMRC